MADIQEPGPNEEPSSENQERGERLSAALKEMYYLGDDAEVVHANEHSITLHAPSIDGEVGVDYSNPDKPAPFFIPDHGPAREKNPLSTENTLNLMATINDEIMAISDTIKFHRTGVFLHLKEKLESEDLNFSHSFLNTSGKGGAESAEVFRVTYKGNPMIIRIPMGIGLDVIPYDPVAEAVEIARLAKVANDKHELAGMSVSVPYAYGAVQMAPQYDGVGIKEVQLGIAATKAVQEKGFFDIDKYLKNGFGVTTVGERFGNVVIDGVRLSLNPPLLYSTVNKLRDVVA